MPNSKIRKGMLSQKSLSFHGIAPAAVPDLLSGRDLPTATPETQIRPRLSKLLLNVTIMGSVGAVQVIMSPESTVADLIAAALRQYSKEGRRPILTSTDSLGFGLHYSKFCLQSLDRDEKLMVLGSRNFFLCPRTSATVSGETTPFTCAEEAEGGVSVAEVYGFSVVKLKYIIGFIFRF